MEAIISLMALAGMGFAAYAGIKWMLKNGHMNPQKEQPLTPNDLKVLEESAARLMSDLRAVTDECVARIENACAQAEHRTRTREEYNPAEPAHLNASRTAATANTAAPLVSVIKLDSTESASQIARQSGMTTGEVELLRGLESIAAR